MLIARLGQRQRRQGERHEAWFEAKMSQKSSTTQVASLLPYALTSDICC
jgi:hypothetical protein